MRKNKQERAEMEKKWGYQNDNPEAVCEARFCVWQTGKTEHCPAKDNCQHHQNYKDMVVLKKQYNYDLPAIRFYYVENFRKCKHKTPTQ